MKEYNWNDRERELAAEIIEKMTERVNIQRQINDLVDIATIADTRNKKSPFDSLSSSSSLVAPEKEYMEKMFSGMMIASPPRNMTAEKIFNEMFSVALALNDEKDEEKDEEKGFIQILNDIEQECSVRILLLKREEYLIMEKIGELQLELIEEGKNKE